MSKISNIAPLSTFPQDFIISFLDFIRLYEKNIDKRKATIGKVPT
jgi:hypothetical protein